MVSVTSGPRVAIAAYKPKPGFEKRLQELTESHVPLLRKLGLATKTKSWAVRAADGTVLEMFEWAPGGIERAHDMPEIQELWFQYAEASTYLPLGKLPEAANMFADFTPIGFF